MRWRLAGKMALGWLFTLPAAAAVGAVAAFIAQWGVTGFVLDAGLGLGGILAIFLISRRSEERDLSGVAEVEVAADIVRRPDRRKRRTVGRK